MTIAMTTGEATTRCGLHRALPGSLPTERSHTEPVAAALFAGPFSLIDDSAVAVAGIPGMAVRVKDGSLRVGRTDDRQSIHLRAGEHYVAQELGVLTLSSARYVELSISLP